MRLRKEAEESEEQRDIVFEDMDFEELEEHAKNKPKKPTQGQ